MSDHVGESEHDRKMVQTATSLLVHAARTDQILRDAAVLVEQEIERLSRRCEVYAAGITAIATYEGEHGLGYETPQRIARQTLEQVEQFGSRREGSDG